MLQSNNQGKSCLLAAALLALAACTGKQDEPAATPAASAAASAPAASAEPAVSTQVQAMGTGELREAATQALHDNRMYAPAGDNAVEYYLALRDKQPDDAAVKSALTDLMPYALIATEQNINREDFAEAQRLIALIEKVDANAPALPRLKQGVTGGMQAVVNRTQSETERVRKAADDKARQLAEQQRLAQQQAGEAQAAQQIAAQQEAARQASARQEAERAEAERQAAARREPAAPRPAAVAATPTLRPISTPAPRYPAEALRSGTSGEVLVEITVGTDGSVTNARVLRATPARVFDREALSAAKRWRFEPVSAPVTTRRTLAFNPGN